MNININNYELYMIDYLDGQLNIVDKQELLLFIQQNPHIQEEFDALEKINLIADKEEVFDKLILKKPAYNEVKHQYQEKLVASIEGDLGIFDQYKLEQSFVVYPELKKEEELFTKTKLQPDLTIVFPHKKRLRKGAVIFSLSINNAWKVAAVLIAFALIVFLIRVPKQQLVADNHSTIKKPTNVKQKQITILDKEKSFTNTKRVNIFTKNKQQYEQEIFFIPIKHRTNIELIKNDKIEIKTIEHIQSSIKNMQLCNNFIIAPINVYLPTPAFYIEEYTMHENLIQLASDKIFKDVLIEENKPHSSNDKRIATSMGLLFVKLYNKATGDTARLIRRYGNDGNLNRVTIVAGNFEFSTQKIKRY